MFFIFGTARSGTTLLAQCLNAHPELVVPHETDFLVPMAFIHDRIRDPAVGRRLIIELIINSSEFAASLGEYLDAAGVEAAVLDCDYHPGAIATALYQRIAVQAGARQAGDKSPNDLNFIRILDKAGVLAEPARIVHIVRDVRDVMASLHRTGWAADLDRYFPRQWSNNNLYLHGAMHAAHARYHLLRYEDLVADPGAELARACRFLGVEFEPGMLDPGHRQHPRYQQMEFHAHLSQPVSTAHVGQHVGALDARQLAEYHRQAGEAMQVFGYPSKD